MLIFIAAYTKECIWRNRDIFIKGHEEIKAFLTRKYANEQGYRLKKELFAFQDNKIVSENGSQSLPEYKPMKQAVQFFYEYHDSDNQWYRAYGLEDWTFETNGEEKGKMKKRMASINDVRIEETERWFKEGVDIEDVRISERDL